VPAECAYDYAIIRVVPRVERGELINVGVILSCPELAFLEACIELDTSRLLALDPALDLDAVRAHLATIPVVCRGGPEAGPIGALPHRGRFHWLVAPRSTMIQMSSVHTGRTSDPARLLQRLAGREVALLVIQELPEQLSVEQAQRLHYGLLARRILLAEGATEAAGFPVATGGVRAGCEGGHGQYARTDPLSRTDGPCRQQPIRCSRAPEGG
jgi:hypothetical protein